MSSNDGAANASRSSATARLLKGATIVILTLTIFLLVIENMAMFFGGEVPEELRPVAVKAKCLRIAVTKYVVEPDRHVERLCDVIYWGKDWRLP